jgi:hypothetical protein
MTSELFKNTQLQKRVHSNLQGTNEQLRFEQFNKAHMNYNVNPSHLINL